MDSENCFPRGGSRPCKEIFDNESASKVVRQKHKSTKRTRASSLTDVPPQKRNRSLICADSLTYQKIQEGMLILGCVHKITSLYLQMELPGRVFGKVEVGNLSSAYINYLRDAVNNNNVDEAADLHKLSKLYFIGQIIPTKVISIQKGDDTKVLLSIDPADINAELKPASYKAGMLIWSAVASKLEHGYLLDVGNENCRVFLPFEYVKEGEEFGIGQTIWCIAKEAHISSGICTMKVSAVPEDVVKATQNNFNLHSVIPGTQLEFYVTKVLKNGLEGKLLNGTIGYVNEIHLKIPLSLKKYSVNSSYKARILYIEPLTKFVFLTFRQLDVICPPVYSVGTIHTIQIHSKTNGGLYIKFSNKDKGFVSEKRFLKTWSDNKKDKLQSIVKTKFPNGSSHQCRILCYNPLEQIYICSLEDALLKEKIFSGADLSVGNCVNVKVVELTDTGLLVKIGQVHGIIQNIHLTNAEYNDNMKKKFSINQSLKVRVWRITEKEVFFTHKEALVKSNQYFDSYESAHMNKQYLGVVAHINRNGDVLVIFYNDLRGLLRNPKAEYFKGQVILTTVIGKTTDCLMLSIYQCALPNKVINVGDVMKAIVKEIQEDFLIVTTEYNIDAKVPVQHLSCNPSLNTALLGTYKVGENLCNLVCIEKQNLPILSLREAPFNRYYSLSNLEVGCLIRGCYVSHNNSVVNIALPFSPRGKLHSVQIKDLSTAKNVNNTEFLPQQPIWLKVVQADKESGAIHTTGRLSEIYNYDETPALDNLDSYFCNLKKIRNHLSNSNPLLFSLHIGQHVKCSVIKYDASGCVVMINNGPLRGLVHGKLCPEHLNVGQRLEGTVLWIDYIRNFVHLALKEDIIDIISKEQDRKNIKALKSTSNAKVLLVDEDFIIAVLLDNKTNNQLIFLPTFIHENSFSQKMDNYSILEVIKVVISRVVDNFIIALDKDFHRSIRQHLLKNNCRQEKVPAHTVLPSIENKHKSQETSKLEYNGNAFELIPSSIERTHKDTKSKNLGLIKSNNEKVSTYGDPKLLNTSSTLNSGFSSMKKFFSSESFENTNNDNSDHEIVEQPVLKKKKKLSASERAELYKQREEEIQRKELENADLRLDPQSSDQFDRLLLGYPNASKLWAKYIAYYVTQTEFDKARAVARRALKTIDFNEIVERFNIWVVMLQLENSHGDKNTFEEVFEEAVRCNEPLDIYLEVIQILAESQKFDEMGLKIMKAKKKFKQESRMWTTIAEIYFKNGMCKEAESLNAAALNSVPKPAQIDLIMRFGVLQFRFGDANSAEALFETILQSHPKKINIWNTYIDQVIKSGDINKARRIFDRAISQEVNIKKLKSILNKYKEFEIKYGTKERCDTNYLL